MKTYLDMVRYVLDNGTYRENRTGVSTYSCFGIFYKVDLQQGFPLLTTKQMYFNSMLHELLWYLSGQAHIRDLRTKTKIWDAWADADGRLETAYGRFWRRYPVPDSGVEGEKWGDRWTSLDPESGGKVFDQIRYVIDILREIKETPPLPACAGWWSRPGTPAMPPKQIAAMPLHILFQRIRGQAELPPDPAFRGHRPGDTLQPGLLFPADHDAGPGDRLSGRGVRPHHHRCPYLRESHTGAETAIESGSPSRFPGQDRRQAAIRPEVRGCDPGGLPALPGDKVRGGVNASNPCSEYMFLDDTACNLASINLVKFLDDEGRFDVEGYLHAIRVWTIVLEISVLIGILSVRPDQLREVSISARSDLVTPTSARC